MKVKNEQYGWISGERAIRWRGCQVKALRWDVPGELEASVAGEGRGGLSAQGGDYVQFSESLLEPTLPIPSPSLTSKYPRNSKLLPRMSAS